MKIAVSTYSFQALIDSGRMTQLECVDKAKEMGFEGIEIMGLYHGGQEDDAAYAKRLGEHCRAVGLPVVSFTVGANLLYEEAAQTQAEIDRLCGMVDLAVQLGAPRMRHDAAWGFEGISRRGRGFDQVVVQLADACREVTDYAAARGVETMVENHGYFCQDSARVERLINAVGRQSFGALCDIGNFLCADEEPASAVGRLAPYAKYVHCKDFHFRPGDWDDPGEGFFCTRGGNFIRGAVLGQGNVPVRRCLRALLGGGYDGWLGIEFEGMEDPLRALPISLCNLRRILDRI